MSWRGSSCKSMMFFHFLVTLNRRSWPDASSSTRRCAVRRTPVLNLKPSRASSRARDNARKMRLIVSNLRRRSGWRKRSRYDWMPKRPLANKNELTKRRKGDREKRPECAKKNNGRKKNVAITLLPADAAKPVAVAVAWTIEGVPTAEADMKDDSREETIDGDPVTVTTGTEEEVEVEAMAIDEVVVVTEIVVAVAVAVAVAVMETVIGVAVVVMEIVIAVAAVVVVMEIVIAAAVILMEIVSVPVSLPVAVTIVVVATVDGIKKPFLLDEKKLIYKYISL
mmetsp:Transcript_33044/g.37575  ORF Transcript_33044/g.37575 Transcript_33044/m.37575 type:complete len:281 (+) Transcript_33044:206-1048(+)